MITTKERKQKFLIDETALSQTEAASVFGCRPRDLKGILSPSFFLNGRPRYRQADVIKRRDQMMEAMAEQTKRNTRILRAA